MTRLDSDYFRKDYLEDENSIKTKEWEYLNDISTSVINFGAYSLTNQIEFLEEGVPFLNVGDIKENKILVDEAKRIDAELSTNVLHKSLAKEEQVLLTIAGTIGNAAVAYELPDKTNSNQAIANIILKSGISPFYISTYLNCRYGKSQTSKLTISSVQPNLLLTQVKLVKVAIPSDKLQGEIERLYRDFHQRLKESNKIMQDINKLLMQNLGFADFTPSTVNYSSRSSRDATEADRFDSEYWLPKYDQLLEVINKQEHVPLSILFQKPVKGIEVGSSEYVEEDGIPFVRVSDFSVFGIDEDTDKRISVEAYEKLKGDYKPKIGELLFTKDGTVGITAVLDKDVECVLSGAFLRLKPKSDIDSHYLALLINSMVCKMQIERLSGGALITHFKPDELAKIVVPIVDGQTQKKIGDEVRNAFKLRIQSTVLLEVAKRAVEVFIEQDEKSALGYIRQNYEQV